MASEWVPVTERMPEPGIPALAAFIYPHHQTRRVIRAIWADRYTLPASDEYWDDTADYKEDEDEYYVTPGWYESNEFDEVSWKVCEEVTHWMPLPPHPDEPLTDGDSDA